MCKSYKDDSFGDATRIPYSALKDYPVSRPRRLNRHDVGLWDGDDDIESAGGFGPLAFGGRDPRRFRRKNTRRWCKGKEGREHKPVFSPAAWWLRGRCRPAAEVESWRRLGNDVWYCCHRETCSACGKVLRESWQIGTDCPDYQVAVAA